MCACGCARQYEDHGILQHLLPFTYDFIIIIIKKGRQCKAERETDVHHISPKTPAPQYQPIDKKKRKGKRVEDYSRNRAA